VFSADFIIWLTIDRQGKSQLESLKLSGRLAWFTSAELLHQLEEGWIVQRHRERLPGRLVDVAVERCRVAESGRPAAIVSHSRHAPLRFPRSIAGALVIEPKDLSAVMNRCDKHQVALLHRNLSFGSGDGELNRNSR